MSGQLSCLPNNITLDRRNKKNYVGVGEGALERSLYSYES